MNNGRTGEQYSPITEKNTNSTKKINNFYSYYITGMNSTMYKVLINN